MLEGLAVCPDSLLGQTMNLAKPSDLGGPQSLHLYTGLLRQYGGHLELSVLELAWLLTGSFMLFWASVPPPGK